MLYINFQYLLQKILIITPQNCNKLSLIICLQRKGSKQYLYRKDFMKQLFLGALFLAVGIGTRAQVNLNKNDLEEVKNRLEGNFDTGEQSGADLSYRNISLHIKEIGLKGKHPDGYFLYAEEANMDTPDKPYRQRIYHLYKQDKQILVNQIYELDQSEQYAGAWHSPEKLKNLRFSELIERKGCAVFLNKDDQGNYYGGTFGKDCENSAKGAAYATSEMAIYPLMLISWDRGFDKDGKQVWGVTKGGYKFRKWTNPRKPKSN